MKRYKIDKTKPHYEEMDINGKKEIIFVDDTFYETIGITIDEAEENSVEVQDE